MIITANVNTTPMTYNLLRTRLLTETLTNICANQLLGFVPMSLATLDCRDSLDFCNPVFAESSPSEDIYNDVNSFLFKMQTSGDTITFKLEKSSGEGGWVEIATLDDNTYGTFWDIGDFTDYPLYAGYKIEWKEVFANHGAARYRFKVESTIEGQNCELFSECFCLKEYNCKAANKTIRIETYFDGKIGSKDSDLEEFDVCDLNWYDSIRVKGYFGNEAPEFEQENVKYANGEVNQIRDEQIRTYTANMILSPMYLFQRITRYGLMSNEIYLTDYNYNNPDLNLKQKAVIANEAPTPTYYNEQSNRLVSVEFTFKDRYETGIKSNCCG